MYALKWLIGADKKCPMNYSHIIGEREEEGTKEHMSTWNLFTHKIPFFIRNIGKQMLKQFFYVLASSFVSDWINILQYFFGEMNVCYCL